MVNRTDRRTSRWVGRAVSAALVLASTQLPLLAGQVTQADAANLPNPVVSTLPKNLGFSAASGDKEFARLSLNVQAGRSRRLFGDLTATAGGTKAVEWDVKIRCLDESGVQVGARSAASKNHTTTGAVTISSSLLFTAPRTGSYTCLMTSHTSASDYSLTAQAGTTFLKASPVDEGPAQQWHNPDCDSAGQLSSCVYLGGPNPTQRNLLRDDNSVVRPWTAPSGATTADFRGVLGLTTCFSTTASCRSQDRGSSSGSTVSSRFDVTQLNPSGTPCQVTRGLLVTSTFSKEVHHFTLPLEVDDVPISNACGSRDFTVSIFTGLVSGNPVKVDGTRNSVPQDPACATTGPSACEVETWAFAVGNQ